LCRLLAGRDDLDDRGLGGRLLGLVISSLYTRIINDWERRQRLLQIEGVMVASDDANRAPKCNRLSVQARASPALPTPPSGATFGTFRGRCHDRGTAAQSNTPRYTIHGVERAG